MILLIFLIIVCGVVLFWFLGRKPVLFKNILLSNITKFLKILLFRGYDRGFLVISVQKDRKPKRFIQIAKYIEDKNKTGLRLAFPHAEWSQPYFNKLKDRLIKEKIKFEIETTESKEVPEFIVVDILQDLNFAIRLINLILTKVFNVSEIEPLELYMINISPDEEIIGNIHQK